MEDNLIQYKLETIDDDFSVEYEVLPTYCNQILDKRVLENNNEIIEIEQEEIRLQQKIDSLNNEIDILTNHADGLDYTVDVGCGVLCGLIDSFWVGEFNLKTKDGDWKSSEKVNDFVIKVAQSKGYKGHDLQGAIKFLEDKYHIASDSNLNDFGGGKQHHLRDFAHHPTVVGLSFSLLTQFTEKCYGTNTAGVFIITEVKNKALIGKDITQKLLFGIVFWFFHMVSDMAGSNKTAGTGTGLPGPIVSLLKEIASLPIFQNAKLVNEDRNSIFSVWISKLFNGTLLAERDTDGKIIRETVKNFDLRAELSVAGEIGKQALPIILNEILIRSFYFIRRLHQEIKDKNITSFKDLGKIEKDKILPFKNRTIVRMVTIASGTFTAIDLADATIRSAIKNGAPSNPAFWKDFVLRVNFVGIGRFAIAVGTDIGMGVKRNNLINERIECNAKIIQYQNAKIFYSESNMWVSAENVEKSMQELYKEAENCIIQVADDYNAIQEDIKIFGNKINDIEKINPGIRERLKNRAIWGK